VVNDVNFTQEVLKSSIPVIVEFGAEWCQPCKRLEPVLVQLEKEWSGKARMVKVDVDESAQMAQQFGVMSVPTTILFSAGQARERLVGLQSRDKITEKFQPYLK
jgi:thioredoxin 1